jgi:hypothetical protein
MRLVEHEDYLEWCRVAMLPRELQYGDRRLNWYQDYRVLGGWAPGDLLEWMPVDRKASRSLPRQSGGLVEVWVPTEADWLDRLTEAGWSVKAAKDSGQCWVLVTDRDGIGSPLDLRPAASVFRATANSWAHALALCWEQMPEGVEHFAALTKSDAQTRETIIDRDGGVW